MKSVLLFFFFSNSVSSINFMYSILMVSLNFNNQKHLKFIDFIYKKIFCYFFYYYFFLNTVYLHFSGK